MATQVHFGVLASMPGSSLNVIIPKLGTSETVAAGSVSTAAATGTHNVVRVPSATTYGAGSLIYVSNESGGACVAFSDGTNWRRVTDRAAIS